MNLIYNSSIEKFERKLRKAFPKFKPFSLTQAKRETGTKPLQLKKWLRELVRRRKLRKANWTLYFFNHPPYKRTEENMTTLKKVNSLTVSEEEELKRKIRNMEQDLNSWKTAKKEIEEMLHHSLSKNRIIN